MCLKSYSPSFPSSSSCSFIPVSLPVFLSLTPALHPLHLSSSTVSPPSPAPHPSSLAPSVSAPRRDSALTPACSLWASAPSSPRTLCLGAGPPKNCLHRHGRDPRPAGGPRHWAAGMPCCPIFPFLSITADGMGPEAATLFVSPSHTASDSSSSSQSQRVLQITSRPRICTGSHPIHYFGRHRHRQMKQNEILG